MVRLDEIPNVVGATKSLLVLVVFFALYYFGCQFPGQAVGWVYLPRRPLMSQDYLLNDQMFEFLLVVFFVFWCYSIRCFLGSDVL